MLSQEEKAALLLQKAEAKSRCREVYGTLCQLQKMLTTYRRIHDRWRIRFEKADRQLAEDEKLKRYKVGEPFEDVSDGVYLVAKMSKEQIMKLAKEIEEMEGGE